MLSKIFSGTEFQILISVWSVDPLRQAELRYFMVALGVPCAMTVGMPMMQQQYVHSWALMDSVRQLSAAPNLDKGLDQFGLMTLDVLEMRHR